MMQTVKSIPLEKDTISEKNAHHSFREIYSKFSWEKNSKKKYMTLK